MRTPLTAIGAGILSLARLPLSMLVVHPRASASKRWYAAHLACMAVTLGLLALGMTAGRVPVRDASGFLFSGNATLYLVAGGGLYILERLCSLVYGVPLRRGAMQRSLVLGFPATLLLVTALLHASVGVALEPALAVASTHSSFALRTLVILSAMLVALPFWFLLLHVDAVFREGQKVRPRRWPPSRVARALARLPRRLWSGAHRRCVHVGGKLRSIRSFAASLPWRS